MDGTIHGVFALLLDAALAARPVCPEWAPPELDDLLHLPLLVQNAIYSFWEELTTGYFPNLTMKFQFLQKRVWLIKPLLIICGDSKPTFGTVLLMLWLT